jgi:hypothetical protein
LKKLSDPTRTQGNIKPKVALLKQKVESANNYNEIGFSTKKGVNAVTGDPQYTNEDSPAGTDETINIVSGDLYIGGGHSHPNTGMGIYSFGDVKLLRNIFRDALNNRKNEVYFLIVCKDASGTTKYYNIKVDNYIELNNYVNSMLNDNNNNGALTEKETIFKIHEKQERIYGKEPYQDYEKSFLKQFKDFGISLYSASDENLTDWKKLQLNPNGTVVAVPCN